MLTLSGIKLIDFGISAVQGDAELDADGGLRGTPSFAAPERLAGKTVESPSDMYSFGVVLYRMLAGRLPWKAPGAVGDPAHVAVTDPEWRYDDSTLRSAAQRDLAVSQEATIRLTRGHTGPNPLPTAATVDDWACSLVLLGPTGTPQPTPVVTVTDVKPKPDPPKGSGRSNGGRNSGRHG